MEYHIHNLSSYDIAGKGFPDKVETKVLVCHMLPLKLLEEYLGFDLFVSIKSGYRSVDWEKAHGRSGRSQHTYSNLGAVDLTFDGFSLNKDKVIKALAEHTNYTRVAVYNSFLHIDYKNAQSERWLYDYNWKRIRRL
ncbi:MAG: hypothetical protein GY928_17120 [Colwellia sp.]|nr:hypothetical protein [Colwellia sp.]